MGMDTAQAGNKAGLLELLNQILSQYGLIVLVLIVIIGLGCILFWRLIWKVWSEAMKAKDDEIARLAKERDKYQALVFERLRTSEVIVVEERKPVQIEQKSSENT